MQKSLSKRLFRIKIAQQCKSHIPKPKALFSPSKGCQKQKKGMKLYGRDLACLIIPTLLQYNQAGGKNAKCLTLKSTDFGKRESLNRLIQTVLGLEELGGGSSQGMRILFTASPRQGSQLMPQTKIASGRQL